MNNPNWPYENPVNPEIYNNKIDWPKISIVTPSYNQGQYIEETILSVLNQNYPNLEYIIIDGGSTDNTVDIVKKYKDRITYWVSEPDKGQSDAINKGLEKCSGEIFNWINSDDLLDREALYHIASSYKPGYSIAAPIYSFNGSIFEQMENKNLTYEKMLYLEDNYNQHGFWFSLKRIKEVGNFDTSLHYAFDRIYTINYLKNYSKIIYISNHVAFFREHPESKTISLWHKFYRELLTFYKNLFIHETNTIAKQKLKNVIIFFYEPQYYVSAIIHKNKTKWSRLKSFLMVAISNPRLLKNRFYLGAIKRTLNDK